MDDLQGGGLVVRWLPGAALSIGGLILALAMLLPAASARAAEHCTAGAHTLAAPGSRVYPETGNGGYTSVHTDVYLVYDPATNRFLTGNRVVLTERATQCLSSFTLDFEQKSANAAQGPELSIRSVSVNGVPASFAFVQPTYPGDPNGPSDPDPAAHQASQNNPVGGPQHNLLPPACSPELLSRGAPPDSLDGSQCPANKLLITPREPPVQGSVFTVAIEYTGRPGAHNDGDGSTEGWFRSGGGSFVATEPVGSEDWMPLNDHPLAKPTYDFYETVPRGQVAVANGVLQGSVPETPSPAFPSGSVTWHWHAAAPIASYLVQSSIGAYSLSTRTAPNGVTLYEVQDEAIPSGQRARNARMIANQPQITEYESRWGGPFPFSSDGVIVGSTTSPGFEEEMETMISFAGGKIEQPVLWHEDFHQWWGDNVSEAAYEETFFKEGLAEWMGDYVFPARRAAPAAFNARLIHRFNATYRKRGAFWTIAPSNPSPDSLFNSAATYERPAAAYDALRQILGEPGFAQALQQIQHEHAGGNVNVQQLEQVFHAHLPNQAPACQTHLNQFFTEWFDTAYPRGRSPEERPKITGPGLTGENFYGQACAEPAATTEQPEPSPPENNEEPTPPPQEARRRG